MYNAIIAEDIAEDDAPPAVEDAPPVIAAAPPVPALVKAAPGSPPVIAAAPPVPAIGKAAPDAPPAIEAAPAPAIGKPVPDASLVIAATPVPAVRKTAHDVYPAIDEATEQLVSGMATVNIGGFILSPDEGTPNRKVWIVRTKVSFSYQIAVPIYQIVCIHIWSFCSTSDFRRTRVVNLPT